MMKKQPKHLILAVLILMSRNVLIDTTIAIGSKDMNNPG